MTSAPTVLESLADLQSVLTACQSLAPQIEQTGQVIVTALKKSGKVLTCGNGGSAADALHCAEEFVGRYKVERRSLPAICLCADVTALTCIGNDYGYDQIFARAVSGLGRPGDVLIAFSTSGNSPNVLTAFQRAREMGITTILAGGKDGGAAKDIADYSLIVPSQTIARIQEVHTFILHQWLEAVDAAEWS